MIDGVLDALAQCLSDARHRFRAERAADGVSAERQRQARDFQPPLAEIDDAMQSGLVVGELAFVNDQTGLVLPFQNLRNDLIEGNDFHFDAGREQFAAPDRRSSALPGTAIFLLLISSGREGPGRNQHGAITVAHAAAA